MDQNYLYIEQQKIKKTKCLVLSRPTCRLKCRTAIKATFLYTNLYLSVMLASLSCSFTSY